MKKIAIMQPYFFPYIGYFSLIKHTDEFILFDTPQFMRHGWIERNRILKQGDSWLYIKVPLIKSSRETAIKDVMIDNSQDWKSKINAQLQIYKKTAPYYHQAQGIADELFSRKYDSITDLNKAALEIVCDYLGISHDIKIYSHMDIDTIPAEAPDEWALNICKALGDVDEYWNPPGGKSFFDRSKYDKAGIALKFHTVAIKEYDQKRTPFEAGLSIMDVIMFNSVDDIHRMLDNYELS